MMIYDRHPFTQAEAPRAGLIYTAEPDGSRPPRPPRLGGQPQVIHVKAPVRSA